jgi:glc operon protein GlcG
MSSISLEEANRIIEASTAKARELGHNMAVAVVDTEMSLVALARMDGTVGFAPDIVRGKAMATVVTNGMPSGAAAERFPDRLREPVSAMYGGRVAWLQGAVPIKREGVIIGAVGAGGGPPDQDEIVAQAGADAL